MEIEVVNYIKAAKAHGLNDQEIKQNLLNAGWEAQTVDESFTYVKVATVVSPVQLKPEGRPAGAAEAKPQHSSQPLVKLQPKVETVAMSEITKSEVLPVHPAAAMSDQNFQPKESSLAKKLGLTLLAIAVLAGGGYAYYTFAYNSPTKVWQKFLTATQSSVYHNSFKASYTDNFTIPEGSNLGLNLKNILLSFEGKFYVNSTDSQNPESTSNVKYTFATGGTTFSQGIQYMLKDGVLYVNIGQIPFLSGIANKEGKRYDWVKIDLGKLQESGNGTEASDFKKIFDPEFKKELAKIWEDAEFIKLKQYLGREKIGTLTTLHFENELDTQVIKTAFETTLTKLVEKFRNAGSTMSEEETANVKLAVNMMLDKLTVREFETWIGVKDGRLYKIHVVSNAPSFLSVLLANEQVGGKKLDAQRMSDMRQLASALELYYINNKSFPPSEDGKPAGLVPNYISAIPVAPASIRKPCNEYYNTYWYTPLEPKTTKGKTSYGSYEYTFCLGNDTEGLVKGLASQTPKGIINKACIASTEKCGLLNAPNPSTQAELIQEVLDQLNYDATLSVDADFSDYGKTESINPPPETLDLLELITKPAL